MTGLTMLVPEGILLPESFLRSEGFAVLAAFVAINTVMYVVLAIAKMLPKIYVADWVDHRERRVENRSIDPRRAIDE
jgi:hypothetical protein